MENLKIPDDIEQVPDKKGGIYFIRLRFPSDYELGLFDSEKNQNRVISNICNKLNNFNSILNTSILTGNIYDDSVSKHLKITYKIQAEKYFDNCIIDNLFDSIFRENINNIEDLRQVTKIIRRAFNGSPPIYIGMTEKQSLRKRLEQHMNGETQFSDRLRKNNIYWNVLSYSYDVVDNFYISKIQSIEKLMQHLFKPLQSKR